MCLVPEAWSHGIHSNITKLQETYILIEQLLSNIFFNYIDFVPTLTVHVETLPIHQKKSSSS